jgi:hypothetical protein
MIASFIYSSQGFCGSGFLGVVLRKKYINTLAIKEY